MLPGLGGSFSGQLLSVTNRAPGSWWLFLAHSCPQQAVLPGLGGSFWPALIHNKSYSRVLVALSDPLLSVTNRSPGVGGSFWPTLVRDRLYSRVLVVLSGPLFWVTNRTPGSWWLLAHSYP